MSLFQNSVVAKQLQSQDKSKLVAQWNVFKNHFHNPTIQDNIRSSKEEQYQGEFLIDLFVNVLGYTKNPTPDFNLTTEYKNVKDSKKADGAILINDTRGEAEQSEAKVKAVIELKGTNTTDLNKIEIQAFGYKNNQPDCVYVITANFEKLRFYIDNATEHIEFNLFNLSEKEFELLYLCLAYENIANDVPKKLKEQSVSQEKDITKKLYTDYSLFKRELHQDLVKQNPEFDALELFQKSQKLLDRFLFIFFAEDRNLLPTNLIFRINKEWRQLQEMRMNISLYDRYKIYFNDLNKGAKVTLPAFSETIATQKEEHQIFAYNGGLFQPDEILDHIHIDDELLYKYTHKLSNYDFASEVDVNILGHIFENSLNELDEIKAHLEGTAIEKATTKRKKDGVFYTPKYITKYIVDNTVGKLCQDKKAELNIIEEDYYTDKKRTKTTKQPLLEKLTAYRNWLLQITICDPACGSGAFLNQALDFLIAEHRYIDELQAKLFGDAMVLSDVEKSILENNLYGVDLNEESVEIAKLSLWLRTAQPNRKLNNLNNNIKCGNSLIDDKAIAGDKAFNWQTEFPKIFDKGGFDVIIGNPPYISFQNIDNNQRAFLGNNYKSSTGKYDIYVLFIEKSLAIIKDKGLVSLILPNKFILSNYGNGIKEVILENKIIEIIDFKDIQIFEGATTYPCIITLLKSNENNCSFNYVLIDDNANEISGKTFQVFQKKLDVNSWQLGNINDKILIDKIQNFRYKIKDISDHITQGFRTGKLDVFFNDIDLVSIELNKLENELIHICFTGKNVKRYSANVSKENDLILFPYIKNKPIEIENFPNTKKYLETKSEELRNRKDSGKIFYQTNKKWFEYWDPKFIAFNKPKIVFPDISSENNFYLDEIGIPFLNTCYSIYLKDEKLYKPILSILNSKLFLFYVKMIFPSISGGYYRYKTSYIENFSIPKIDDIFIQNSEVIVNNQINNSLLLFESAHKFRRTLQRKFELESLPKKLQDWYLLSYSDFIKELGKLKVKLTLSQEAEWEEYFTNEATKVNAIKTQINATDKAIDAMVYALYGLSEEEIAIVEQQ
ncbi:MAG TPA: N-6 DNA methylase [Flavobacterium sp.]|nr:N-6 DNA methylase [Flavobacterium sp.]